MASQSFIQRGGSEPEYQIYQALYSTGRKEPQDFVFRPPETPVLSFVVFSPRVGLRVGQESATERLLMDSLGMAAPRVEFIDEGAALSDGRNALLSALGG